MQENNTKYNIFMVCYYEYIIIQRFSKVHKLPMRYFISTTLKWFLLRENGRSAINN